MTLELKSFNQYQNADHLTKSEWDPILLLE